MNTQDLFDLERCKNCKHLRWNHFIYYTNGAGTIDRRQCNIVEKFKIMCGCLYYEPMTPLELSEFIEEQYDKSI